MVCGEVTHATAKQRQIVTHPPTSRMSAGSARDRGESEVVHIIPRPCRKYKLNPRLKDYIEAINTVTQSIKVDTYS